MTLAEMRIAVFASPVSQRDVAKHYGCDESTLSSYLNGKATLPTDFETKFNAAFQAAKDELRARL